MLTLDDDPHPAAGYPGRCITRPAGAGMGTGPLAWLNGTMDSGDPGEHADLVTQPGRLGMTVNHHGAGFLLRRCAPKRT